MTDRRSTAPPRGSGTRAIVGRVLVVEDNDAMRDAFRDLLEDAGYVVRVARHGEEALAILRREPISVVVLDLRMPSMDGREFRRLQLDDPAIADVPIVVVTAERNAALDDLVVLRKPFDLDELLDEVARLQTPAHGSRTALH
jgi:CheY-like chemotaxis protein